MKFKIVFILVLQSVLVFSQETEIKSFYSESLGTARKIKVYIPESYAIDSTRFYPLTVLLDGDYLFDLYLGNMKLFAQKDLAPEQILVGIFQNENDERYRDTSYDKVSGLPTEDSEKFYRFVRGELIGHFEKKYRISPFKTVVGNTLTGNFINYFAVENDLVFDAFININPYYNPDMVTMLARRFAAITKTELYYYVSSGKYNKQDVQKSTEQVVNAILDLENPNILLKYDKFDNATSISSIGQSIPAALAHIFSRYGYITPEEYASNIQHLTPSDAIDYLKRKYVDIEYMFGTNLKIREKDIYAIENIVIDEEDGRYLAEFGNMIKDLYPESPLSDYYFGMFYEKQGKYSQALKNYKNGYAKIKNDISLAEAYYQNIERVQGRADEVIQMQEAEKNERESRKEEWKDQRKSEKEMMEKYRKSDDK